jgi:hypothetical protein
MIGKKDTLAIFESYQTHLKEQNDNLSGLISIADSLARSKKDDPFSLIISDDDLVKLANFLRKPEIVKAYEAFKLPPLQMSAGAMEDGGITKSSEGDASAANMGEGGVLEVQPDGQYSR